MCVHFYDVAVLELGGIVRQRRKCTNAAVWWWSCGTHVVCAMGAYLLMDKQVGLLIPFSMFLPLYTLAVALCLASECSSARTHPACHILVDKAVAQLANVHHLGACLASLEHGGEGTCGDVSLTCVTTMMVTSHDALLAISAAFLYLVTTSDCVSGVVAVRCSSHVAGSDKVWPNIPHAHCSGPVPDPLHCCPCRTWLTTWGWCFDTMQPQHAGCSSSTQALRNYNRGQRNGNLGVVQGV